MARKFFFERQFEIGREQSVTERQTLCGKSKMDADMFAAFKATIESIEFKIEISPSEVKQIEEEETLSPELKEKIRKAGQACATATKDADKVLSKYSPSSQNARSAHDALQKCKKVVF